MRPFVYCVSFIFFLGIFTPFHQCAIAAVEESDISESAEKVSSSYKDELTKLPFFDATTCRVAIGMDKGQGIDLSKLARLDGFPRYEASYNVTIEPYGTSLMHYAYNPCVPYTFLPDTDTDNPPLGSKELCKNVTVCKYNHDDIGWHLYGLGFPSSDSVKAVFLKTSEERVKGDKVGDPHVALVYSARLSAQVVVNTSIRLVCDETLTDPDDGVFTIVRDNSHKSVDAELRHACCCPGVCWTGSASGVGSGSGQVDGQTASPPTLPTEAAAREGPDSQQAPEEGHSSMGKKGENMLVMVGSLIALVLSVALIGGLCYVRRTHLQFYTKLPGITPNVDATNIAMAKAGGLPNRAPIGPTMNGHATGIPLITVTSLGSREMGGGLGADFRDYEPSAVHSARRKPIPVLPDPNISTKEVDMSQRLGGGCFMDTHLAKWREMTVSVKRLTLSIHDNQRTTNTMNMMKEEVWTLSRLRHKNIVCVLGLSLDGRLPFLLTEFVVGECLKDFLRTNGRSLIWPQRIRLCGQVAEGMTFLHSAKPPIIHRDLRCGNIFLSDNDNTVKVADFGLTKLLQPLREHCDSDDCGCQRQMSACPPSIRWTAPELLARPRTFEGDNSCISTSCDVYSFSMVMLEMVVIKDPFHGVATETEVMEIVKNSGRPEPPPSCDVLPQYKDLMKLCWDQRPSFRPAFKQITAKLKEMVGPARSHQKHLNNQQRHSKSLPGSTEMV